MRITRRGAWGAAAFLAALAAGDATRAQAPVGNPAGSVPGPVVNPYTNPLTNPFLNPALTAGTVNRNDALIYLWAAQQQPGGLLSGRAANANPAASARQAAQIPSSAARPGGGAARYFGRSPVGGAYTGPPSQRFSRHNRYFNSTGR